MYHASLSIPASHVYYCHGRDECEAGIASVTAGTVNVSA